MSTDEYVDPNRLSRVYDSHGKSGHYPTDKRLFNIRHGKLVYEMKKYYSKEEWIERANYLRSHILLTAGLWPFPEKTPLDVKVVGRVEREGYAVEKVYFQSYPGFFVTGNLYRPLGKKGPFPGVACPHGHWTNGRLENCERGSVPARCINLALLGCVAFSYDMVGYLDSKQADHNYSGPREDLWYLNPLGLQLWNSIRVLDFLSSLPDVDDERLGCTGASGGGTQTFLLSAVDDRVKVAAPVNMVSAHFQGGCICENAPSLRLDTSNLEIAAMMAPRPLLLVACTGDWTKNTPKVEYPAIKGIYELFDADDRVDYFQVEAEHNYNKKSREAVYSWFNRWLLGNEEPKEIKETSFQAESEEWLRIFPDGVNPPSDINKKNLTEYLITKTKKELAELWPKKAEDISGFRDIFSDTLFVKVPNEEGLEFEDRGTDNLSDLSIKRLLIGRKNVGDKIPALLFTPSESRDKTLLVCADGKEKLLSGTKPGPLLKGLLKLGQKVLAIDPFLTGEYHTPYAQAGRNAGMVNNPHFTTFNQSDIALRVQDIITAAMSLIYEGQDIGRLNLVGLGEAGLWTLLAAPLIPSLNCVVADTDGFDPLNDDEFIERLYIPGICRVGHLRTACALTAPTQLMVHNISQTFPTSEISEIYKLLGVPEDFRALPNMAKTEDIIEFIKG